jgi:hypothetical protein
MIEQIFTIYNFLANKINCKVYLSINEFEEDLSNNLLDNRFIAKKYYDIFDIDKQEIIGSVYTSRNSFEWIKIVNTTITEFYRRTIKNNWFGISYDVNTFEPIEYYKVIDNTLYKFDFYTNEETGFTNNGGWEALPDYFKNKLDKTIYKNRIIYWAEKPYGNIIGVLP